MLGCCLLDKVMMGRVGSGRLRSNECSPRRKGKKPRLPHASYPILSHRAGRG